MKDVVKENFKAELKELLRKYNAEIYSIIEGDTHGIDYEAIVIDIDNKEALRFTNPSEITHHDIK